MNLIPARSEESVVSYLEDWTNNDEVNFAVCQGILEMVYRNLIESILAFNIVTWFGALAVRTVLCS